MSRVPSSKVAEAALELLDSASERGVELRAIGGLAVKLSCPSASRPPLERAYKDIDLVGPRAQRDQIDSLLVELGYDADAEFNLLNGDARLYYWDRHNERQLDVFLDRMDMCHSLELASRLHLSPRVVSPTDLLLSKLQVVETNERDLKDAAAVLLDCEIDLDRIAAVVAADWGWWRTVTMVLDRLELYVASLELPNSERLRRAVEEIRSRAEAEPKSRRWRLRAKVGDRVRWYALPEEDHAVG
jgi:hypothetical protein